MTLSVIMMTYNHENFIEAAVNGILLQKVKFNIELIIADDFSTDNTENKCRLLESSNSNISIHYIRNKFNLGPIKNFKCAYNFCSGKYIALCEGDDYWTDPYKLQKQVNFLESNEEYSHCWTRFYKLEEKSNVLKIDSNDRFFVNKDVGSEYSFQTFASGWELGIQTLVFKKDCFDVENFKKFKYFRDIHLIVCLLEKGKGFCINSFDAVYRIHGSGIHSGIEIEKQDEIAFNIYKEIFNSFRKNEFLKYQFRYFITKHLDNQFKKDKLNSFILLIEFQYYFSDWNYFKHHIKQLFGQLKV